MEQDDVMRRALRLYGSGIAHSLSPQLFACAFEALDLPWSYTCVECPDARSFAAQVRSGGILAANVTLPYKADALRLAQTADETALRAGGANLLIYDGDSTRAYNTDGKGAVLSLSRCGVSLDDASAVVCGTGVTARSIANALAEQGARVSMLSRAPRPHAFRYGSQQADEALRTADVVVDATPLGMNPLDGAAFDLDLLSPRQLVLDVVYGHGETALRRGATQKGCRFLDGLGMLMGQAAVALPLVLEAAHVAHGFEVEDFFDIMEKDIKSKGGI